MTNSCGVALLALALVLHMTACSSGSPSGDADTLDEPDGDGGLDADTEGDSDFEEDSDIDGDGDEDSAEPEERCPAYLQESWVSIHADCYNSDYSNYDPSREHANHTVLIEGYASIAGLGMDESRDRIYIARGASAAGDIEGDANLVAIDTRTRELVWDAGGLTEGGVTLGPCAATSAPIVARNGDIYIADCDHMWAIHPDGSLRWRAPLPESPSRPYFTAFFVRTGEVGGVTSGGRVDIFDHETGDHLDSVTLPQPPEGLGLGDRVLETIVEECIWVDETGDGRILEESVSVTMLEGFFGRTVAVGNTPAAVIDPDDEQVTRIFVPGLLDFNDDGEADTELYRIDFDALSRRLTYVEDFDGRIPSGGGSASSPNVSPDGAVVMIADTADNLHGFDAATGETLWSMEVGQLLGSATTDLGTGIVWIGNTAGELQGFQLDLEDRHNVPERVFYQDLDPIFEGLVEPVESDAFPVAAVLSGVVSKTPGYIMIPFTIGYRIPRLPEVILWPMRSVLVVLDNDGNVVGGLRELHDVVESGSGSDSMGQVAIPHTSISSSLMHCIYRRRERFGRLLGEDLRPLPEPLAPRAGISLLY